MYLSRYIYKRLPLCQYMYHCWRTGCSNIKRINSEFPSIVKAHRTANLGTIVNLGMETKHVRYIDKFKTSKNRPIIDYLCFDVFKISSKARDSKWRDDYVMWFGLFTLALLQYNLNDLTLIIWFKRTDNTTRLSHKHVEKLY